MPSVVKGPATLSTGTRLRIVEVTVGPPPIYVVELSNLDAMGNDAWSAIGTLRTNDFIAALQALGVLA